MQITHQHGSKNESHSANRFNDSEYQRWSAGIRATRAVRAESGIANFLNVRESLPTESENICTSSAEIGSE
jgi:hypothetical protein